jgi:hypothetical protein
MTTEATQNKPAYVEAVYTTAIQFEIEEVEKTLNISWDDVEHWNVRWGCLQLTLKDGKEHTIDGFEDRGDIDWKRPDSQHLLNGDFDKIEDESSD